MPPPAPTHPTLSHFPHGVTLSIHPPAPSLSNYHPPTPIGPALPPSIPAGEPAPPPPHNVLLLLHGLGDTHAPYTSLGKSLNLVDTLCVAVRAPNALPFGAGGEGDGEVGGGGGYHWGNDVIWDQVTQGLDVDGGFEAAMRLVGRDIVKDGLVGRCGYSADRVVIWGMGQGGCLGLAVAAALEGVGGEVFGAEDGTNGSVTTSTGHNGGRGTVQQPQPLAGVISLGGPLPSSVTTSTTNQSRAKCKTPILLVGGSSKSALTDAEVRRVQEVFADVTVHRWRRAGDGMPKNREEMVEIMRFLARVTKMRVPEGMVEVS